MLHISMPKTLCFADVHAVNIQIPSRFLVSEFLEYNELVRRPSPIGVCRAFHQIGARL
jgi:hypothetical protein